MANSKRILKTASRYLFYVIIFLLFAFATLDGHRYFLNFLVNRFSQTMYVSPLSDAPFEFYLLICFIVLCYTADCILIRRSRQRFLLLPVLLACDMICLFVTNIILLIYNNWKYGETGWAEARSLNNIPLILFFLVAKAWWAEIWLKRNYGSGRAGVR